MCIIMFAATIGALKLLKGLSPATAVIALVSTLYAHSQGL